MATNSPRDLVGYGGDPPHPHWPGEARIAVNFVMNYEEGSESVSYTHLTLPTIYSV